MKGTGRKDSQVVFGDKPASDGDMMSILFRERQRLTNIACQALAEGAIPALLMGCQSSFLTNTMMGFSRQDRCISTPEITVGTASAIGLPFACQSCRQLASERSPMKKATICRVRRHNTVHNQRWLSRRSTNDQASSNSRTSST